MNSALGAYAARLPEAGAPHRFVVDEYGDLLGLVTLEDILEAIVGEFTTDPATMGKNVQALADGAFPVSGGPRSAASIGA